MDKPPSNYNDNAMSANSIPNLLSLRGPRGGARIGRGSRPRGGLHPPTIAASTSSAASRAAASHDTTIQGTDTDAAVSRLSAVDVGYLDDPYAQFFVQSADSPATRRLPIINRGTYARTKALDTLVDGFLAEDDEENTLSGADAQPVTRQIISLGAGTDTRPFRLFERPRHSHHLVYHEIDFPVTCTKKLRTVQATPRLRNILTDITSLSDEGENSASWSSKPVNGGAFYFHAADLRNLAGSTLAGLRTDVPTLLLSECCLCYLAPNEASSVVDFFASRVSNLATIIYEPIRPDDAFGKMMVSNLAARRIRMPTLDVFRAPADQEKRLRDAGFETVRHLTVEQIWDTWVAPEEKERVDWLEGLDEVEEWKLLAAHYLVVWGFKGNAGGSWISLGGSGGGDGD